MKIFVQLWRLQQWLAVAPMKLDNSLTEDFRIFRLRLKRGLIYLICIIGPLLFVSWFVAVFAK